MRRWLALLGLGIACGCSGVTAPPTDDLAALHRQQLALLAELGARLAASASEGDLDARLQLHEVDAQIWRAGLVPLRQAFAIEAQPLDAAVAKAFGLEQGSGAMLTAVQPGGAAAGAGLRIGDCLFRVNGSPLCFAGPEAAALRRGRVNLQILRPGAGPGLLDLPCVVPPSALEISVPDAEKEADALMQRALRQVLREQAPIVVPNGRDG